METVGRYVDTSQRGTHERPSPQLGVNTQDSLFCFFSVSRLFVISAVFVHVASSEPEPSVNSIISRTYQLLQSMKENTTILLNTYRSHQGSPFTDPDFKGFNYSMHYKKVPLPSSNFPEWSNLSDIKRLEKNYQAYHNYLGLMKLVWEDQSELNPDKGELLKMLKLTQKRIQGLLSNLTAIISALGGPSAPVKDPPVPDLVGNNNFEKKELGYVVCFWYRVWVERTLRDFNFLRRKYPS
ncbi:cardiotrophin-2 isoform X1 [Anolis carolinensis]|uniref:cardiotrophin-2 isoform X1 n=1 Tax=Anolis carolinensis TaxID=28377 RepID=UPI002F2B310A